MGRKKLIVIFWAWLCVVALNAGTYTFIDGQTVSSEAISYDRNGVVFRSNLSRRIPWNQFSQEALLQLKAERPQDAGFIEPYLEGNQQQQKPSKEIVLKPVDRVELPKGRTGLLAGLSSPLGFVLFLVLYGGNLFAAREIAVFKNFKLALVCGVSAAAPVIGPIVFLCLRANPEFEDIEQPLPAAQTESAVAEAAVPEVKTSAENAAASAPATTPAKPSRVSAQPKFKSQFMLPKKDAGESEPQPEAESPAVPAEPMVTFKRSDFTFNRRFFETKMAGFLRVIPGEMEKQTALCIRSARGEFIGQRISKITTVELYLEVFKENVTAEEKIPFNEIYEVQLRPKDSV